jgi:hypothetical protein
VGNRKIARLMTRGFSTENVRVNMAYSFFKEKEPGALRTFVHGPCGKNTGFIIRLFSLGSVLEA